MNASDELRLHWRSFCSGPNNLVESIVNELAELKARYEKRILNLRAHRTDPEAVLVIRQIEVVEGLLAELAKLRAELYSLYDDDHFNTPSHLAAIKEVRGEIAKIKERVTTLGFERYITPDMIDRE